MWAKMITLHEGKKRNKQQREKCLCSVLSDSFKLSGTGSSQQMLLLVVHELSDESNVSENSERMIHNGQNITLMWYPWKFFTLLRVDVTCTFWKGQIVSDWVSTWEYFGSLCFLHLDLSYMEFLERATMVNRTSSGSRSMKVLQTPKASYSQAHKTMSNHK